MSLSPQVKKGYRSEIQGLRGVAMILIMGYHIWVGKPSGGIDIFIMLSGFFLIGSFTKQVDDGLKQTFRGFVTKLFKRLLPNALFIILLITIAMILIMPKIFWHDTLKEIFASALYFENWQLAFNSRDYLAAGNRVSPLQHYWSLSIQGQLYILWFLIMTGSVIFVRRFQKYRHALVAGIVSALGIASFLYANKSVIEDQSFAYFNTFARLWEFALGGVVAFVIDYVKPNKTAGVIIGWIGIVAIITCGALIETSKLFPGYATLWPTLACALILLNTGDDRFNVNRVLRTSPLIYIGNISYALFLWHWPVLIFFLMKTDREHAGLAGGIFVIIVSLAGASLTTKHIEGRFTLEILTSTMNRRGAFRVLTAMTVIILILPGLAFGYVKTKQNTVLKDNDPNYPGALALESNFNYEGSDNVEVIPNHFNVKQDIPSVYENNLACIEDSRGLNVISCDYGKIHNPERVIALVGGSYSAHWLPALEKILEEEPTWKIVTYIKSSCPFSLGFEKPSTRDTCEKWNTKVITEINDLKPDLVITTSTRTGYSNGNDEVVPASYEKAWAELENENIRVLAIRDVPRRRYNLSECVALHGYDSEKCILRKSSSLAQVDPSKEVVSQHRNVYFADLTPYICPGEFCEPVVGNVLVARDHAHMTATFSRTLAPFLKREILASINQSDIKTPR